MEPVCSVHLLETNGCSKRYHNINSHKRSDKTTVILMSSLLKGVS